MNPHHRNLLDQIKKNSAKGTSHTFLDSYLGTSHPRYAIDTPTLRKIAKDWARSNVDLDSKELSTLLTDLIRGESLTEKSLAGILLGYSKKTQRDFDPKVFDEWLDHLEGWAEIDGVCTGPYTVTHLVGENWPKWKKQLTKFNKDKNIAKRRASLVLLCSPTSKFHDEGLAKIAFKNMERLQFEKDVLITRAISWLLRSMIKFYRKEVEEFIKEKKETLPKIAIRETMVKLKTGKKTARKDL